MRFIREILRNLLILLVIGLGLFMVFPDVMRQVFQIFGSLFGPALLLLLIVVTALPRRRRN